MSIVRDSSIGFAIGNAMGLPVEGESRENLIDSPVINMIGEGVFDVKKGTWGFDTSQFLIMMDSMTHMREVSCNDIADCFIECIRNGQYTVQGTLFDIDKTTEKAIQKYEIERDVTNCGEGGIKDNDNGALPRMIPLAIYCHYNHLRDREIYELAKSVTSITHCNDVSILGSYILVKYILFILNGKDKYASYNMIKFLDYSEFFDMDTVEFYNRLLKTNINKLNVEDLKSEKYIVYTLETVLWIILNCQSAPEAIVGGINLGGDTSMIGALCGSISGMINGLSDVPAKWLNSLEKIEYIEKIVSKFEDTLNIYE